MFPNFPALEPPQGQPPTPSNPPPQVPPSVPKGPGFFGFLKSKSFWLGVAHVALIGAGGAASFYTGVPWIGVATSVGNALLQTPLTSTPTQEELLAGLQAAQTISQAISKKGTKG